MMEENRIGIIIWGTKNGYRVLCHEGIECDSPVIRNTRKDISHFICFNKPLVDFYILEFTEAYKVYTQCRSIYEVTGRPGAYIAVSLYIPYDKKLDGLVALLNRLMNNYFEKYVDERSLKLLNVREEPEIFLSIFREGAGEAKRDDLRCWEASKQDDLSWIVVYPSAEDLKMLLATPYREEYREHQKIIFLSEEIVYHLENYSAHLPKVPQYLFMKDLKPEVGGDRFSGIKGVTLESFLKDEEEVKEVYEDLMFFESSRMEIRVSKPFYEPKTFGPEMVAEALQKGWLKKEKGILSLLVKESDFSSRDFLIPLSIEGISLSAVSFYLKEIYRESVISNKGEAFLLNSRQMGKTYDCYCKTEGQKQDILCREKVCVTDGTQISVTLKEEKFRVQGIQSGKDVPVIFKNSGKEEIVRHNFKEEQGFLGIVAGMQDTVDFEISGNEYRVESVEWSEEGKVLIVKHQVPEVKISERQYIPKKKLWIAYQVKGICAGKPVSVSFRGKSGIEAGYYTFERDDEVYKLCAEAEEIVPEIEDSEYILLREKPVTEEREEKRQLILEYKKKDYPADKNITIKLTSVEEGSEYRFSADFGDAVSCSSNKKNQIIIPVSKLKGVREITIQDGRHEYKEVGITIAQGIYEYTYDYRYAEKKEENKKPVVKNHKEFRLSWKWVWGISGVFVLVGITMAVILCCDFSEKEEYEVKLLKSKLEKVSQAKINDEIKGNIDLQNDTMVIVKFTISDKEREKLAKESVSVTFSTKEKVCLSKKVAINSLENEEYKTKLRQEEEKKREEKIAEEKENRIKKMKEVWKRIDSLNYTMNDLYMVDTLFQNEPKDVINKVLYDWNKGVKRDMTNPSGFVKQRIALLKELLNGVQAEAEKRIKLERLREMVNKYKSYFSPTQREFINTIEKNKGVWEIFNANSIKFKTLQEAQKWANNNKS